MRWSVSFRAEEAVMEEFYVGADLSRKRVDWQAVWGDGALFGAGQVASDAASLAGWAGQLVAAGRPVIVVESMTGARFVHDVVERAGATVLVADARKARERIVALAATRGVKTDRTDAAGLADLARLGLVPEVWLPDPRVRSGRELARFRLHLVKHRTMLKNRVHQTLFSHGVEHGHSDLFGAGGRRALARLALPEPWQTTLSVTLELLDDLEVEITACQRRFHQAGYDHPDRELVETLPGVARILGYTIACEIGDITRFATPTKLVGYTGLCPQVRQSGQADYRGPLKKNGPKWLRWALIEAAHINGQNRHSPYYHSYQAHRQRLGNQRGPAVAAITVARKLAKATWHVLASRQAYRPSCAARGLAA
jgi:transposase